MIEVGKNFIYGKIKRKSECKMVRYGERAESRECETRERKYE